MTVSFVSFLNETGVDSAILQNALGIHLSQRTQGLTSEKMLDQLRAGGVREEELQRQLQQLEEDSAALEQAALLYFERLWNDPVQRPSIETALKHARGRVRGGRAAISAVLALYALFLCGANGVTGEKSTIAKKSDGTYHESSAKGPRQELAALKVQAWTAFSRDLDALLAEVPGQWVAYRGAERVCAGNSSSAVYQECLRQGYAPEELFVEMVYPAATEEPVVFLPATSDFAEDES